MIKDLIIKNFKSVENLELSCLKFNIFIGEPNVGKSNILEALGIYSSLLYNKHTKDQKLISKEFVRYENLLNLFHNNFIQKDIEIITDKSKILIEAKENYFKYTVCKTGLGIKQDENQEMYRDIIKSQLLFEAELENDGKYHSGLHKGRIKEEEKLKTFLPNFKMYKHIELNQFLSKDFAFLNPPSGNNLLTILQTHEDLYEYYNDILHPFNLRLMLREIDGKIEFLRDAKGKLIPIPFSLIAETFQQLFLILAALETNEDSIIVIEEPETHVFPKYTKKIAEMIAKNEKSNQFFISTHNPYFLISLIEKAKEKDISIFAVEFVNNETQVKKLDNNDIQLLLEGEDPFFNIRKYFE